MNTWIMGDMHFGHRNICKFRPEFATPEDHEESFILSWNERIKKGGDRIFVLGDAAFTLEGLHKFKRLNGRKILIRGNHDTLPTQMYLAYFEEVYGIIGYKGAWLSHAPIHPDELRGKVNIHGHVHSATIQRTVYKREDRHTVQWEEEDPRYINACPEKIGYAPVLFNDLMKEAYKNGV
jgi:calcineurin-like phosphoesterase family protein